MGKRYTYFAIKNYPNWRALIADVNQKFPKAVRISIMGPGCPSGGRNSFANLIKVTPSRYMIHPNYKTVIFTGIDFADSAKLGPMFLIDAVNTVCKYVSMKPDRYGYNDIITQGALRVVNPSEER